MGLLDTLRERVMKRRAQEQTAHAQLAGDYWDVVRRVAEGGRGGSKVSADQVAELLDLVERTFEDFEADVARQRELADAERQCAELPVEQAQADVNAALFAIPDFEADWKAKVLAAEHRRKELAAERARAHHKLDEAKRREARAAGLRDQVEAARAALGGRSGEHLERLRRSQQLRRQELELRRELARLEAKFAAREERGVFNEARRSVAFKPTTKEEHTAQLDELRAELAQVRAEIGAAERELEEASGAARDG